MEMQKGARYSAQDTQSFDDELQKDLPLADLANVQHTWLIHNAGELPDRMTVRSRILNVILVCVTGKASELSLLTQLTLEYKAKDMTSEI